MRAKPWLSCGLTVMVEPKGVEVLADSGEGILPLATGRVLFRGPCPQEMYCPRARDFL